MNKWICDYCAMGKGSLQKKTFVTLGSDPPYFPESVKKNLQGDPKKMVHKL